MKNFKPYANESVALAIGEMNVENREDRVSVYGNMDLTRDKAGLEKALALKAVLDAVVESLSGQSLRDAVAVKPIGTTKNPFSG